MGEIIIRIAGNLIGDSSFFLLMYPKNQIPKEERENRDYIAMPVFSIFISIAAITVSIAVSIVLKEVLKIPYDILREIGQAELAEAIKNAVLNILSLIPNLSSMACYMLFYRWTRKGLEPLCFNVGKYVYEKIGIGNKIYVKDKLADTYYLSEKGQNVRDCIMWIALLDMLLLAILYQKGVGMPVHDIIHVEAAELIPITCLTVLFETWHFLGGDIRQKWTWFLSKFRKKKPDVKLNLPVLKVCMNDAAQGDNIIVCMEEKHHDLDMAQERRQFLERYEDADDARVQYFLTYIKHKVSDRFYHMHCVDTVVRLLQGENIFYATPFYYDIDICIFFPAYMSLIRNERVLVLIEDTGNLHEVADWVKRGVEEIPNLEDFWNVDIVGDLVDNTDVGIMSFQDIYRDSNFVWQDYFFSKVSFVVILEASGILSGGQEAVITLFRKIGTHVQKCNWLLCDRNAESMIDLFSHLLNKEFTYVSATPYYAKDVVTAYWNAESEPLVTWTPAQRYLGIESRILEAAAKEKIAQIVWYGEECMPIYDLKWVMGQYYAQYGIRTNSKPIQSQIDDCIDCRISGNENRAQREQFLIVEDDCFNLYELARQYATRAEEKIFVNIISPRYMMRDFMRARSEIMNADPKWIVQFVPEYINSRRNITLRLVRKMLDGFVSETEILNMFVGDEDRADNEAGVMEHGVRNLVGMVLETTNFDIRITCRNQYSESAGGIKPEMSYRIVGEEVLKEMDRYFSQANYIDEEGSENHISRIMLAGHLDQKYQVGQFAVFNGKYYEIMGKDISGRKQSLLVKRASDQITGRKYYRQNRGYQISRVNNENGQIKDIFTGKNIIVHRYCADITAHTFGYVELDDLNDICGGRKVFWNENAEERSRKRIYKHKQILEVKMELEKQDSPLLIVKMAAMIAELFYTLYSQHYHLLSVAVDRKRYQNFQLADRDALDAVLGYVLANMEGGRENCFYILEDSREDIGLLPSIGRNFHRILEILDSYLEWSKEENDDYFEFHG